MATINDPVVQLKAVELIPQLPTFLWDLLVEDKGGVAEGEAIWDFRKGDVTMAPFVAPNVGGVVMERQGFVTNQIEFPTIAPERIIQRSDIMKRSFDEPVYGGKSPEQRDKELTISDLKYLKDAIQLRREWMAAQLLMTGKLDIQCFVDGGLLSSWKVADYGFTNEYTPSKTWADADGDPDADMDELYDMVTDGLGSVDVILMAKDVANAMLRNTRFVKNRDIRNIYMGMAHPMHKSMVGVQYIGTTNDGVDMFSYSRRYKNDAGMLVPYIPDGKLVATGKKIFKCYHGPVTQIEQDGGDFKSYIAREVPFKTSSTKSNSKVQRLTSRPMLIPENVDAWAIGNVL